MGQACAISTTSLRTGASEEDRRGGEALLGLIRSGLLKRFESSAAAFVKTAEKMAAQHNKFLEVLRRGKVPTTEFLRELAGAEDENEFDTLFNESKLEEVIGFDKTRLRQDVLSDRDLLLELAQEVRKVAGIKDPKFDVLCDALAGIAEEARNEGFDEDDSRQKRKVLVFSYFEDTVDVIEAKLFLAVKIDARLAVFQGRIASTSGTEYRSGVSRKDAVEGFAPISTRAGADVKDRFDLLITTDVLAEGQNLQQARHIINYDLPWNPMRLVQRHGRIDRIGSPHPQVFMRTIFPDDRLDDLLKLEERVRRKLAHAAASVGVETSPIALGATGEQVFAENREEVEKLYRENPELYERGGTASAAQTGGEYRQVLRQARKYRGQEIDDLPWKAGSAIRRGNTPGWFFCSKVGERTYLCFVHANKDGSPSDAIETEMGFCLRQIECTEDFHADESALNLSSVYLAWDKAKASILVAWDHESDPINLQPKVRPLNKSVAEFLRTSPPNSLDQDKLSKALDILESPWPRREENLLREWYEAGEPSHILVEYILKIGIEPFSAPEPLPPIEPDEVHLVVWLAIAAAEI